MIDLLHLPRASKIEFSTCNNTASIRIFKFDNKKWCCIKTSNHPDRYVRLFTEDALRHIIKMYAYVDGNGCLNKSNGGRVKYEQVKDETDVHLLRDLTPSQLDTTGVPQRVFNSGLCWYCAMCFVILFSRQMRSLFLSRSTGRLRDLLSADVLTSLESAEALRHYLYHKLSLGDRPGQAPHLDGQNGFSQLCILAAHLKIPMTRLFAPEMHVLTDDIKDKRGRAHKLRVPTPNEPSLLVVRCFRTRWRPHRRLTHDGIRYKLVALMIGSEHCGHQIGASTCDSRVCRWALADSDGAQQGIGPMFWSLPQKKDESRRAFRKRWRDMWDTIIPAINFGNKQVCDLNPSNRPTHELERLSQRRATSKGPPGVVNTDWIFLSVDRGGGTLPIRREPPAGCVASRICASDTSTRPRR